MPLMVGELAALLDLDANPFTKKLDSAMSQAERAGGQRMQQVGGKLTKNVTLPLGLAAGAAVKLGTDFDTAFSRMVGLAGVPQAEVDGLKDSVLDLAGETAVAPQQLADALYFAASAGLDAAGAMDAVTYAAKASAAGMGEAQQIVGLVASAVASYGEANIDAARATDILTAAVRAGRADPAELAGTLGRVLPIASQLGISFEEVGGAVAYLSNVFGDTNRTVTALSGLMVKLVSPTQGGRDALEEMGTSVEELQAAIDARGLMGALDLLREKGFAGNQRALRALFDDIEGYQGALALLNDKSGSLADTMDEVSGSAGALGEAFDAASSTPGFKMKQALTDVQVAAIQAGDAIAPFAATVASGIGSAAEAFSSMPPAAQTAVVAMAGVMAAVGPLATAAGKLAANWSKISSAFETAALKTMYLQVGVGSLALGLGVAAPLLFTAATALNAYNDRKERTAALTNELAAALEAEAAGLQGEVDAVLGATILQGDFGEKLRGLGADVGVMTDAIQEQGPAVDDLRERFAAWASTKAPIDALATALAETGLAGSDLGDELTRLASSGQLSGAEITKLIGLLELEAQGYAGAAQEAENKAAADEAAGGAAAEAVPPTEELTDALLEEKSAAEETAEALDQLLEATLAQFDADVAYRRSVNSTEDAVGKMLMAINDSTVGAEEQERAILDAESAMLDQAGAAVELAEKQAEATGKVLTAEEKTRLYKDELYRLAGTLQPGSPLFNAIVGHMEQLDAIPGNVHTVVTADLSPAQRALELFTAKSWIVRVEAQMANPYLTVPGLQVHDSGGPVRGPKGSPQLTVAHGGEIVLPTHRMGLADALRSTLGASGAPTAAPGGGGVNIYGDTILNYPKQETDKAGLERATRKRLAGAGL